MSMSTEFNRSLPRILVHEGGYVNHPKDPGGETNKGVTRRVYDTYRRSKGLPEHSVRFITDAEKTDIYKREYWDRASCDKLPPGVSYVVFDGAVNSGVSQSVKWLQRALQEYGLYAGKIDGQAGQGTIDAVNGINDHDALIAKIIFRRNAFLRALKTWKTFGKGWTARVTNVLKTGQAWAMGSVGPAVVYVAGSEAKARLEDAKGAASTAPGDVMTGGGGISVVISQAQEQLTPYVNIGFVARAVAVLTIGGAAIAIGGLAWRWWAQRQKAARLDALDISAEAAA